MNSQLVQIIPLVISPSVIRSELLRHKICSHYDGKGERKRREEKEKVHCIGGTDGRTLGFCTKILMSQTKREGERETHSSFFLLCFNSDIDTKRHGRKKKEPAMLMNRKRQ